MNSDDAFEQRPKNRRKRGFAVGLGLIGLGIGGIWLQRAPIATQMLDSTLTKRGIPARYSLTRLDPKGATLENLVIGAADAPDLVASNVRVRIGWRLTGAYIAGIDLDHVLMRGTLDEKGLNLGQLDKLRPAPSGKAFALPDLNMRLRDVRMRLATSAGTVGIAADGNGNLANGFIGRIALSAPRLRQEGCTASDGKAMLDVAIRDRTIKVQGPAGISDAYCAGASVATAIVSMDATLPETLDAASGRVNLSARSIAHRNGAKLSLASTHGGFNAKTSKPSASFDGVIRWEGLDAPDGLRRRIMGSTGTLAGTPLEPLARQITPALANALRSAKGEAQIALIHRTGANNKPSGRISLSNLGARSTSGAQLTTMGRIFSLSWPSGTMQLDGALALSGGGLPATRLNVQSTGRGAWQILGDIAPYAAGGARLALSPVVVDWNGMEARIATLAQMDGPLAGGRIEGLALPINARLGINGSVRVDGRQGCLDLRFKRLDISGLRMGQTHLPLCGDRSKALFVMDDNGHMTGNVGLSATALRADLNGTPVTFNTDSARLGIGGTPEAPRLNFALGASGVSLKQPEGETWLKLAGLNGAMTVKGLTGTLKDTSGAIVNVPLLVDQANGDWQYRNGVLDLNAPSARVRDAVKERRFEPVTARNIRLTLKNGMISGNAVVAHPKNNVQLALVSLKHDLSASRGNAVLDVPTLTFGDSLQPEALTPLTLGVIANVGGTIKGRGNIRWSAAGITSDGAFETDSIGLSAAFGQVHNIKGRIVFDDLLGMTTPPGQTVTMGEMNPGVSVKDGTIRFQLLPEQHVKVEDGRWPFSGGELILEPTVLDFSKPSDRIFSLTVVGLDAAQFIQQFEFKNLAVTGLFDGKLPLVFNAVGGRIVGGRLVARQGGGKLAYVGEVSEANLGGPGKLAFDALKSMKYNALVIEMDGELDGEIISTVLFNGSNEAPVNPTGSALPVKATGLPFKFNITVRAPFRALMSTAESFTDVRTTVRQAMPTESNTAPVQPPESRNQR